VDEHARLGGPVGPLAGDVEGLPKALQSLHQLPLQREGDADLVEHPGLFAGQAQPLVGGERALVERPRPGEVTLLAQDVGDAAIGAGDAVVLAVGGGESPGVLPLPPALSQIAGFQAHLGQVVEHLGGGGVAVDAEIDG